MKFLNIFLPKQYYVFLPLVRYLLALLSCKIEL